MSVPDGGQNPPQDPQPPQQGMPGQAPGGPVLPPQAPYSAQPPQDGQVPQASPAPYGSPAAQGSPAPYGSPAPQGSLPPYSSPAPAPQGAAAPASAPGMTPQELRQKLTSAGVVNPLPSLAVGAATYVSGIVLSVLTIVLIAIAAAFASIGNPVEAALETADMAPGEALSGVGSALRFPFQLVAMAMLGSLGFSRTIEGESLSASIRLLPGVITVAMVLVSFYGGRFVQKRQAAGRIGIWVSSVLTGFGVALVTVLAALLFAQPIPIYDELSLRLHAAGFDAFFGAFFLVTLALALGRISVRPRRSWWALVTDLTAGFKLGLSHALIVTVLGVLGLTVVTTIQALIDGEKPPMLFVILLLPLVGGHVLAYVTGLEMLSSVSATLSGPDLLGMFGGGFGAETASIFSMPWYVWLGGLLISAIGLLLASLLWQHQRQVVPHNVIALGVSWVALPIAYFVGSMGLLILARLSLTIGYSGSLSDGERISAAVGLAAWTPLLALLAGVIVELLSRFVAPLVAPYVPRALLAWFRRPLAPALVGGAATTAAMGAAPSAPDAPVAVNAQGIPTELPGGVPAADAPAPAQPTQGSADAAYATVPLGATGGAPTGAGATDPSTGQAAAPAPLSPRTRKLLIAGGIAVGGAFVLIVGLAIAFNVIASTMFSPEKKVEAYLTALQDGDAATAVEISAPNAPTAQQVLLTNAIAGSAEDRISGFEIIGSDEYGDDGMQVTAEITQDGVTSTRTFEVDRAGRTAVVFPEWRMGETEYAYVALEIPEGATTLLVNGQEVAVESLAPEDGFAVAAVLPGAYSVSLPEVSEFLAPEASGVYVTMDPEDWYELYAAPSYTISEAGVAEVQTQVDAVLDECAASTEADPEGCPLRTYVYGMVEGSGSWTIDTYPAVAVEAGFDGWRVSTADDPGEATFAYQRESWSGDIEDESESREFTVSGSLTIGEDGSLAVELDDGW